MDSQNFRRLSVLRISPMTMAAAVPTPAAWVGLKRPAKRPPSTKAKRKTISKRPVRPMSFCLRVVEPPAGAEVGLNMAHA